MNISPSLLAAWMLSGVATFSPAPSVRVLE